MKAKTTLLAAGLAILCLSFPVWAQEAEPAGNELVVADFNTGDKPNNIGGDFGSWDKDPNDETQFTQMAFEPDDATGDPAGYSIRLDYDVDSPNPAYNGFWMKLNGEDGTPYNTLSFFVKGDGEKGFTKRMKIELKDMSNVASPYIVTGITEEWQEVKISFEKFRKVSDWSALNEFVVVFDDINSSPKAGTIFLDHVTLKKE
jgi:opacity protein-like surface antigen